MAKKPTLTDDMLAAPMPQRGAEGRKWSKPVRLTTLVEEHDHERLRRFSFEKRQTMQQICHDALMKHLEAEGY